MRYRNPLGPSVPSARWWSRHATLMLATALLAASVSLFFYAERTMPIGIPRLLLTVAIAYGGPLLVILTWVLRGRGRLRRAKLASVTALALGVVIWAINTSLFAAANSRPYFIAHQGVHQVMDPEHNSADRCLGRIEPPLHDYIENTIPSIQAAFDLGARIVEIDIRPTVDGQFVVFHDDMLDCKTEASGLVREHSLAELERLDVGFGYFTASGNHPLRGKGVGMMRSLNEVLDSFPDENFFIDVKFGNDRGLWERLIDYLAARPPEDLHRITVHGVPRGAELVRRALPVIGISSYERAFLCVRNYMLVGWSGFVPSACHHSISGAYTDTGWLLWGWPKKFVARMEEAEAIVLMRPRRQTELEFARSIPEGYTGGILTDRIESFKAWMDSGSEN